MRQALKVGAKDVVPLLGCQMSDKGGVRIRKHGPKPVQKPIDLGTPPEKHPTQHQATNAVRVRLGIRKRKRAAPRAAKQQKALDPEMPPQRLDIVHQIGRGVLRQAAKRARTAGPALIEDDHTPEMRVEKAPMNRPGARPRPAMQKQHRRAARVANLLPVHDVATRERHVTGLERAYLGKEVATGHRHTLYQACAPAERGRSDG